MSAFRRELALSGPHLEMAGFEVGASAAGGVLPGDENGGGRARDFGRD